MSEEAEMVELRRQIAALSVHKNARRYPAPLRAKIAAWTRRRLAAGVAVAGVCADLDIGEPTLRKILEAKTPRRRSPRRSGGFAQLKVVSETGMPPRASTSGLVLRGPLGVVVEGLSVEDLTHLLRELSCSG